MRILAVETSTLMGSVAVVDNNRVLCELTLHVEETHSSQLMPAIDYVLKTVGLTPPLLDGFAVALGPGSFTGLRIGLSTVKGLAVAASKPVAGIPTLEAMAWSFPFCPYLMCPLIDARMKEVYGAWFRAKAGKPVRESEDMVLPISHLLKGMKEKVLFFGSGAQRYREEITGIMGELAHFASPEIMGARASIVGFLGGEKMSRRDLADVHSLEPLYIRESQAIAKLRDPASKR
ncbi:MAG: tRNA (adenosine(37)-N6)-threonylcarbamoyltransferase complex dimerization subunit type 1 TsaB [Candidatus Hydrogenedentota bacterium]|nr:MAG: tRNA (adenosine(37)-N6)-threonylcarbamoyltransferase complex dimerization subunit type 1 TsaB [Candidatus Hydrogenedentota bacterium]